MTCYNLFGEHEDDDDMHNVNILELEGSHDVAAFDIPTDSMSQLLKLKKVNIGMEENLNFANIGDYWDDETMAHITDLLQEFQDIFFTWFSEMKGILGDLEEMKIPVKLDTKPVRQRPYPLNPRYKERFKVQLEWMLDDGIIDPIEELEWISPMVVQDKKTGEFCICVDLRKLNDAFLHDSFPTPFTDEVLEGVVG